LLSIARVSTHSASLNFNRLTYIVVNQTPPLMCAVDYSRAKQLAV